MATLGKATLETAVDESGLKRGIGSAEGTTKTAFQRMGGMARNVLAAGIAVATTALVAMAVAGAQVVGLGSDLNETVSKTHVIFGSAADAIVEFSEGADAALGQTQQGALDAASTFGTFGKSAGLAGEDLSDFSIDLVSLASDLASFHNTAPEEAVLALGAALRGETEPMRRYGVLLDDASLRQKAWELGLISTTKNALTPQQKVLASYNLILEQTADAQGDFARTSDGLANQQRILRAELTNVATTWGSALLPVVQDFVSRVGPVLIDTLNVLTQTELPAFVQAVEDVAGGLLRAIEAGALLLTWNQRLGLALQEQTTNLLATSTSYDEYINNLAAAEIAAGNLLESEKELFIQVAAGAEIYEPYAQDVNILVRAHEVLTEAEFEGVKAGMALEEQDQKLVVAYMGLNPVIEQTTDSTAGLAVSMFDSAAAIAEAQAQADQFALDNLESQLSQDIGSPLTSFIQDIQFFIASGGQDFMGAFEGIKTALAQGKITPEQAADFSGELLASVEGVKVAAEQVDFGTAAANLAEALNIPLAEAQTLITEAGTALDTMTAVERTIQINQQPLIDLAAEIDTIDANELILQYSTADATTNVETFTGAVEEVEGLAVIFGPLQGGLSGVAGAGQLAEQAIIRLQRAINDIDTSNLDPFIAHSPAPLALGLEQIADRLPAVVAGLANVGKQADRLERLNAILDRASSAARIGGTFAGIFEARTVDPLKAQLESLDDAIEAMKDAEPSWEQAIALNALQQQRADLAKEIANQEERILKLQEKQQELDFIQARLDLLELAKELGLDTSIFQGMLGLGADPAALTDLMDEVIQALIDQANESLETGSPSKVFENIASTIPAGMERAIMAGATDVADSTRALMNSAIAGAEGSASTGFDTAGRISTYSTGGGTRNEFIFDFRGAHGIDEQKVEAAVERAMSRKGVRADVLRRTK